jgi:hypothetical protein
MVGAFNVPLNTGLTVVPAAAAYRACDPDQAFLDAASLASLFQRDRATVAAGLLAAMTAEAFRPGATSDSVARTALRIARTLTRPPAPHDGAYTPGFLVSAALRTGSHARSVDDLYARIAGLLKPYSKRDPYKNLALAVAVLVFSGGDFRKALETAALERQSPDYLAWSCGAVCGALGGVAAIPEDWAAFADGLGGGTQLREDARALAGIAVTAAQRRKRRCLGLLAERTGQGKAAAAHA